MVEQLYPFESRYLKLGDLRYHYVDQGPRDGDPVVMVHGNPTWSFYFRDLIKTLQKRYRCVAPDHIGMGKSDKPGDKDYNYTLASRVDDLAKLIKALNFEKRITLVVHDWGGMIGMAYATRYPERIARIVVLNTGAFHLPQAKSLPFRLWLCRNTWLGACLVRGRNAFAKAAAKECVKRQPLPDDVKAQYLAPYDSWANRIATLRFVQDIPLRPGDKAFDMVSDIEQKLPLFQQLPMLICWGMRDFVFDQHFLRQWVQHFPNAKCHRFEDAGHYILEDAKEQVNGLIKQFLRDNPLKTLTARAGAEGRVPHPS